MAKKAMIKLDNLSVTIDFKKELLPQIIVEIDPDNKPAMTPLVEVLFHHKERIIAGPNEDPNPLQAKLTIPKIELPVICEYIAILYAITPKIVVIKRVFFSKSISLLLFLNNLLNPKSSLIVEDETSS